MAIPSTDVKLTAEMRAGWDRIDEAFAILGTIKFPDHYLSNLKSSALKAHIEACDSNFKVRRYVYLAFYGNNGIASHLKIGMSKSPAARIKGLSTGNPLRPLWAFVCELENVRIAGLVERALLASLKGQRAAGEWVTLGDTDYEGAKAIAVLLKPAAERAADRPVTFTELKE